MSTSSSKTPSRPPAGALPIPQHTLIAALLAAPADRPFVTMWEGEDKVESVTFGAFIARARQIAAGFHAGGAGPGDRVILVMPQGIDLMAAFAGAMMLGAVPAILAYPNFKVEASKYRTGLAGVSANLKAKIVAIDAAFPQDLLAYVDVGHGAKVIRAGAAALSNGSAKLPEFVPNTDTVAFIQHSAGTTGLQKGVALTHAAVLRQLNLLASALKMGPEDKIYSWLPLYHDMGLIACFMLPMCSHTPVIMQSPTEWVIQPGSMLQLITEHRCTLAWTPNFTLQFLARRVHPDDRETFKLDSMRAIINCSEPVRPQSVDEFLEAYAPQGMRAEAMQASYAMAENVFAITQSGIDGRKTPARISVDPAALRDKHIAVAVPAATPGAVPFMSSGRLLPDNEVRIEANGNPHAPEGSVGEIFVRSRCLFDGYFNRPDLTEKALQDGWYRTGDLGFFLDGELFVIGRKKDLIIVAGKNIYPQDVEELTFAHPKIHDGRAVAFGMYNPDLGTEDIVVVAEVNDEADLADSLTIERAVKSAIFTDLGVAARGVYLKPPRWIVKSTAGKPARAATRDKLVAEHPELNPDRP